MESLQPLRAIVWAQYRTSLNFYLRANKAGAALKWLLSAVWYGGWALAGAAAATLFSGRVPADLMERALAASLFFVFFFWQIFPILLASQGAFIDMRKLLVYPIPRNQLFLLETVLRLTTGLEVILVSAGIIVGLLLNRQIPVWSPLPVLLFLAMNLFLATGLKLLLQRLFQKKGVREAMTFLFLGLVLVPQLIANGQQTGPMPGLEFLPRFGSMLRLMPWSAAASLASGRNAGAAAVSLVLCTAAAFLFARRQFDRSLRLDDESGGPERTPAPMGESRFEAVFRFPSLLWRDPLAALVEKDIRTLFRAPRFRLIFLMASTFGAVLWLPQVLQNKGGWLARNYVTMATLYGMLVLGDVLYWNVFGFERWSVQQWFVTPVRFGAVLRAKNVTAAVYTLLAIGILSGIGAVLPIGIGPAQVADAVAAAAAFLVCVTAAGNLTSVYFPRPIDASQAWRNSAGKIHLLLLLSYPLLCIPVALAQLARWATASYWAYHGVLVVALLVALCFYIVATESAEEAAEARKEKIVAVLSHQDGPVSIGS